MERRDGEPLAEKTASAKNAKNAKNVKNAKNF